MSAPLAVLLALFLSLWTLAPAQATETTDDGTSDGTTTSQTKREERAQNHKKSDDTSTEDGTDTSDGTAGTSGDTSEPQPESTADENDGGANGDCPDGEYCSTRDGSASENGEGDGEATGKPCAGCVGKADNKNPQGQMPGGSDENAGYECDTNKGVGQGNPAHTACEEAVTAEEPGAGEAGSAEVLGVSATAAKADAAAQDATASQGLLPDTGANGLLTYLLLGGLGLLAVGAGALWRARRLRLGS